MNAIPSLLNDETSVEFGGTFWTKKQREDGSQEYGASQQGCYRYHISQYQEGFCAGLWHWSVHFSALRGAELRTSVLSLDISGIEKTRDEAMQACLDGESKFISDLKNLTVALGLGDYMMGFMDGQSEVTKAVMGVLA